MPFSCHACLGLKRYLVLLTSTFMGLLLSSPLVVASGFSALERLQAQGFQISAEVRRLDASGQVLASIQPMALRSPASVTKAYLAAAVLDRFGPAHRFTTQLVSRAALTVDGHLEGDLVLVGGGDPGLDSERLWRLVQRLRQAGVRRVKGHLTINQWRFGPVTCLTTDRCEARDRVANSYSAPLSSAGVNHGSWCVNVAPAAAVGVPARITHCDGPATLTRIDNRVETVAGNSTVRLSAERISDDAGDIMRLSGEIGRAAAPRDVYRGAGDSARQTARILNAMLASAGISVAAPVQITSSPPDPGARTLASVKGDTLQTLLLDTMHYSSNYMADVLALNLLQTPRGELDQAGQAIEAFTASLAGHGEAVFDSGSGLTTTNRTSAHGINTLLADMYRRPSLFPAFAAGFQAPANAVSGHLRRGSDRFRHHVMIKTGTLNQPYSVRAAAGYLRDREGRWLSFAVLVNGTSATPYLSWSQLLEALSDDLEAWW